MRFDQLRFGQAYRDISTFQLSATRVEDMNMISVENRYVFVSWTIPGRNESTGIARYQFKNLSAPPSLTRFARTVRHFQVDVAEGALLVVMKGEDE